MLERVRNIIEKPSSAKVNTVFNDEFVMDGKRATKSVNTRNCELFRTSDLREWYKRHILKPTLASLKEFQKRDSAWALARILDLTVNVNKYNPMRAGCHLELPQEIMRAVVNVCSVDNACFAWSVVAALYPVDMMTLSPHNVEIMSLYPHYTTVLNFESIEFPVLLKDVTKFERFNNV